jgi:hypothetical protein
MCGGPIKLSRRCLGVFEPVFGVPSRARKRVGVFLHEFKTTAPIAYGRRTEWSGEQKLQLQLAKPLSRKIPCTCP